MISFQASVSKGWLHQKGGFEFSEQYYMDPLYRRDQDQEMNDFVRRNFGTYPLYNMEANLMQVQHTHENQVLIGGIQPNLILANLLGAGFVFYPDKDMDVSGSPLSNISETDGLPKRKQILEHPLTRELSAMIDFLQRKHAELEIIPPFFWDNSGRATIHGVITTSFKLIGDNAMMMIIMQPDLLHAVHQWITDAYVTLINHFAGLVDFKLKSMHVGECSGALISGVQYLEFVTPYISQLGRIFSKIRLHSCGHSDHILEAIAKIDHLNVIDTGSDTSIAEIRRIKGRDFEINVEPPVKLLLMNSSENDLSTWFERTLDENQGGPLKIAVHLDVGYSVEKCLWIYEQLMSRGLVPGDGISLSG